MREECDKILSASSPRMGNRFTRWLGRFVLRCIGWKMVGKLPAEKKLIIVGMPRSSQRDVTSQMVNWFDRNENVWMGITPEGTRSKVGEYKKGYLRISKAAGVPIALIGIDARSKEVVLHEEIWKYTGRNNDEDNAAIKNFADSNFFGINQKKQ